MSELRAVCIAACIAMLSCGPDADGPDPVTTVDSAGIRLVTSRSPVWDSTSAWHVGEVRLDVGGADSVREAMLHLVQGVVMLPTGEIVVANGQDSTLRWYGPAGDHIRTVGGQGDGPEEFTQIRRLQRAGDEIWVFQWSGRPTRVFGLDGTFLRSVPAPQGIGGVDPIGVLHDRSVIWNVWADGRPVQEGLYEDSATFVRRHSDGRIDSIAQLLETRFVPFRNSPLWQTWGPRLFIALSDSIVFTAFSDDFDIEKRDWTGRVLQRIRRSWEPQAVTQDHIDERREDRLSDVPPPAVPQITDLLDTMIYPDVFPAHGEMMVDATGSLWVRRLEPMQDPTFATQVPPRETSWDVFSVEGTWLGTVRLPSRFRPDGVGADYVVGVWKDELDVEHLRVYSLVKPAPW